MSNTFDSFKLSSHNRTLGRTKPDGTQDTFIPIDATGQFDPGETQSLGTLYFYYTPNMAGDWSVTMSMPEQTITDATGTVIYQACTSKPAYFTVTTEEQLAGLLNGYPWAQLPNENTYWEYPISSNNREWNQISGDWLQPWYSAFTAFFGTTFNVWQPYGTAPNTPHILWSEQKAPGGLVGGDYGSLSYGPPLGADVGGIKDVICGEFVQHRDTGPPINARGKRA